MRNHRSLALLSLVPLALSLALTGCGDGGPSVRAEPDPSATTTTSDPTTTTSTEVPITTTTTTAPTDGQVVRYQGLQLVVPTAWPVHDLAADPRTCVRVDRHAVFLGKPGPNPDCPAHLIGHTTTVLVQPVTTASDVAIARATVPTTINGMTALVDPDPDANGSLTVVLPDLGLVAFITYGESRTAADVLLATFGPAVP